MDPFKSKKKMWWSIGILVVLAGFFVAAVLLPSTGEPYGSDAPDVHVPGMKNVPEQPNAPPLELETTDD